MAKGTSKDLASRGRWTIPTPKAPLRDAFNFLKRGDAWIRIGMCALTITILFVVMFGWSPAFEYRTRTTPGRDLHARTTFEFPDSELIRRQASWTHSSSTLRMPLIKRGVARILESGFRRNWRL